MYVYAEMKAWKTARTVYGRGQPGYACMSVCMYVCMCVHVQRITTSYVCMYDQVALAALLHARTQTNTHRCVHVYRRLTYVHMHIYIAGLHSNMNQSLVATCKDIRRTYISQACTRRPSRSRDQISSRSRETR
jgi:hypothetical protein